MKILSSLLTERFQLSMSLPDAYNPFQFLYQRYGQGLYVIFTDHDRVLRRITSTTYEFDILWDQDISPIPSRKDLTCLEVSVFESSFTSGNLLRKPVPSIPHWPKIEKYISIFPPP